MRRVAFSALVFLVAAAAVAGSPHALDRSGVLWSAISDPEGLVLIAQRDGVELQRSTVPFAVAANGATDSDIQVAADELTGKVAVVWQRNWSATASEIMVAVFKGGAWERVTSLSADLSSHPRYPAIRLTRISSTVSDAQGQPTAIDDSFLHVVWWDGSGATQHGWYGLLCLTAGVDEDGALTQRSLDDFVWGNGCFFPAPQSVLERPLFASQPVSDRAYVFHGSRRACLFQLLEVSFTPPDLSGITVTIQRRRHTPVFGVRKLYAVPTSMSLDGARMLVGTDLNPVAYRVTGGKVEFISSTGVKWTPKRSLPVGESLSVDQAIPLIESLVR